MVGETHDLSTPDKIARIAEEIYEEKFKKKLEEKRKGEFVVIDVLTSEAYPAKFPEKALDLAREKAPYGVFHLIRIGAPGTFKVSYASPNHEKFWNWPL